MVRAYILITVQPGSESEVAEALVKMKEVEDMDIVYGECDIIMKVNLKTMNDLRNFTVDTLRKIKEIRTTKTMIAAQ